ncbi:MAG: DUF1588 domain-containing protein [Isosphaeraceae bacterium]
MMPALSRAQDPAESAFRERVAPILEDSCVPCHGPGARKGGLSLDAASIGPARLRDAGLWQSVLRNVRGGRMPPPGRPRLDPEGLRTLESWIKSEAFGIDPRDPDPGRVTLRRLNRAEYRNTIRDLMGVDYDTGVEFPPDDSGHGFDTIADVLTLSPLLMEKYLAAAESIVAEAVPTVARVAAESEALAGPASFSYYEPASIAATFRAGHPGHYRAELALTATEMPAFASDYNKCRLIVSIDGRERLREDFAREENRAYRFPIDLEWAAGDHALAIAVEPLTPGEKRLRSLAIRVDSMAVRGPFEPEFLVRPPRYERFFPGGGPSEDSDPKGRARWILSRFARKAFRRPADDATLDRLVDLAVREGPGRTFEAGVARAFAAILASPRFLFREDRVEAGDPGRFPLIDEHSLASRLSYFLTSSMPDEELSGLADRGQLRANLAAQASRLLADGRSGAFVRDFAGQWLQAREVGSAAIHAFDVIRRDEPRDPEAEAGRERWRQLGRRPAGSLEDDERRARNSSRAAFFRSFRRFREHALDDDLRTAMRLETEMVFGRIVREDRPLRELLDGRETFLNERLAKHYGIGGVEGDAMRLVALPPDSPRGGILTQGSVLAVTSNPDRTSPVKRGLFILDNILGAPPPPPPPNIPSLEESARAFSGRSPTTRELLEFHRKDPSCRSCHERMDPLGLALENFNALGRWRDREQGRPVDASGTLGGGEPFGDVRAFKRLLAEDHLSEFHRCLAEKMLTYALGRGLTPADTEAVDRVVGRVEREGGRAGALIAAIVESPAFQRTRRPIEPPGEPG